MWQVECEEPVFQAVMTWVNHSAPDRKADLPALLQHIRIPLMTPKYITDVVDKEVRTYIKALMAIWVGRMGVSSGEGDT